MFWENDNQKQVPLNLPLLKGASVVGVFWGRWMGVNPMAGFKNFFEISEMIKEGKLKPVISHTLPLARAAHALEMMGQRKVIGKVIIKPGMSQSKL